MDGRLWVAAQLLRLLAICKLGLERPQVNATWLPQMGLVLKAVSKAQPQDNSKLSKPESVIHTRALVNGFRVKPKWTNNLMSWEDLTFAKHACHVLPQWGLCTLGTQGPSLLVRLCVQTQVRIWAAFEMHVLARVTPEPFWCWTDWGLSSMVTECSTQDNTNLTDFVGSSSSGCKTETFSATLRHRPFYVFLANDARHMQMSSMCRIFEWPVPRSSRSLWLTADLPACRKGSSWFFWPRNRGTATSMDPSLVNLH